METEQKRIKYACRISTTMPRRLKLPERNGTVFWKGIMDDNMQKQKRETKGPRPRSGFARLAAAAMAVALCFPSAGFAVETETVDPEAPQEQSDQIAQDVTADLADGSIYLREQGEAKQYSRDSVSWIQYEGTFTITGTTSANAIVSVSGNHDILLQDATIDHESNGKAAIHFESGSSTLAAMGDNNLAGGQFYPAVEVASGAKLVIAGDGTLNATGGDAAPAIGCNGIDGTFGELTFEHTGTVNATAGSDAPALGDSDPYSPTGKVVFKSGTVGLSTSSFETDIAASRVEAWGGSILPSKRLPVVYTRNYLSHPFGSGGGEATYLCISGLPEGFNLVDARLYYGESWVGSVFGSDAANPKTDYGVSGISPIDAGQNLGIFLFSDYFHFSDHMYIALAENNGSGRKYEGYLTKDETTGGYRTTLTRPKNVQADPIIDVGAVGKYQDIIIGEQRGQKAYSTDSGSNWQPYSGSLTLTGRENAFYTYPNARVKVIGGNHDISLFNLTMICTQDTNPPQEGGVLSIEGTSSVNLTLLGRNSLTENLGGFLRNATINIEENAHLVIGGKGSLSVINDTLGSAAIGSREGTAGGTLAITGGVIDAKATGGYFGAAIGSGRYGSLKSISITGGVISAHVGETTNTNAIGAGNKGSVDEVSISGGTIEADRIGATKTVITGGTINGVVQKPATPSARTLADAPSDDATRSGAVNEAGEAVVPVTFSGLPAGVPLSDMDFGVVNIDLVDVPSGGDDYGVRDVMTSDEGTLTFYLTSAEAYKRLALVSCDGQMLQGVCEYTDDGSGGMNCALEPTDALLFYQGHTFEAGWLCEDAGIPWATDGASSEAGDGSALTALRFESPVAGLSVEYAVDNGAGFGESVADGDIAGEMDSPIQAVRVSLSGEAADGLSVRYRVYSAQAGWSPWMADGQEADSDGNAVTAIQSMLVPAGQDVPGPSDADKTESTDQAASATERPDSLANTGDGSTSVILLGLLVGVLSSIMLAVAIRRRPEQN